MRVFGMMSGGRASKANVRTKRVGAKTWTQLEWAANIKCVLCIKKPAGARVRVVTLWLFGGEQHVLDGSAVHRLITSMGKIQIYTNQACAVQYTWDPVDGKPITDFPSIPLP